MMMFLRGTWKMMTLILARFQAHLSEQIILSKRSETYSGEVAQVFSFNKLILIVFGGRRY